MEEKKLSPIQMSIVGTQFMFVAFGSTVLVPLLVGLDPSTALFSAGICTLLFHLITKGMVPIYLGSSFAFIAPIQKATELYGLSGTLSGLMAVGAVYGIMSLLIKTQGTDFIRRLFPPIVIGPVIMLIGLTLSSAGVNMAKDNWGVALISLSSAVIVSLFGRGMLRLIPILIGIIVGYVAAFFLMDIDLTPVKEAAWFGFPQFVTPTFSWEAILFMIPVAIAPVIEHIGDVYAIGNVAGKNYVKEPGLHRTMLGDGLACVFAGTIGAPPVTTYSEVTGAVSLTKMTNPAVLRVSAVVAILFSLCAKFSALLSSIPAPVLGGIMLLLFGTIASVGVGTLIRERVDIGNTKNMIVMSVMLTLGIGGAVFEVGTFSMQGIGLSALVGVILNLVLPEPKK